VLEANFANEWARDKVARLPPFGFVQVYCTAAHDVVLARYAERVRSGARHAGHGGGEILAELAETLRENRDGPLDIEGTRFDVVTDRFEDIDLGDIEAAMPENDSDGTPYLVVVTGPPASGKSTIARMLAGELKLPIVTKDVIKERLYETFGSGDDVEARVEAAALAILFSVVASNLAAGMSVLAEGNFDARSDVEPFRELGERFDAQIVQVHLDRETERIVESFVRRAESGRRHPGHGDEPADAEEVREKVESGFWAPLKIRGTLIDADADGDVGAVVERARAVLADV
jgi:predicted kinase